MSDPALDAWLAARRDAVEAWLATRFADAWPPSFRDPLRYPIETSGKRVRPALCLGAFEAVTGAGHEPALPAAAALELVHTYSLVHDDLPAMDDAATRRERPTVHVVWNDATAVLVGDALLTEAFAVLAEAPLPAEARIALVGVLAQASGYRGMVGGQAADVGIPHPGSATVGGISPARDMDEATLLRLHRLKTGALIEAAVLSGAIVAGATAEQRDQLGRYGRAVGLAFQLADDLLDADEDSGDDGPPSFVRLLGVGETRRRAEALVEEARAAVVAAVGERAGPLALLAEWIVKRDR